MAPVNGGKDPETNFSQPEPNDWSQAQSSPFLRAKRFVRVPTSIGQGVDPSFLMEHLVSGIQRINPFENQC